MNDSEQYMRQVDAIHKEWRGHSASLQDREAHMTLTITHDDLDTVRFEGSVWAVTGTADDGSRVTFAGDARVMGGLLELVEQEGEFQAEVEPWQVLGTQEPCTAEHPDYPGLMCNMVAHSPDTDHYALGYQWPGAEETR